MVVKDICLPVLLKTCPGSVQALLPASRGAVECLSGVGHVFGCVRVAYATRWAGRWLVGRVRGVQA